ALNKCPNLTIVPPHHDIYEEYSERVNAIYRDYTEQVEKFGIDESWLDVTGSLKLFGSGEEIAHMIKERVKKEIGITISVGVSFNKVFAKLGSDLKKPDAVTVLSEENYKEKIYNLPCDMLLYVGRNTAIGLKALGINTIGDIASADERLLSERFGKHGKMLSLYAKGLDSDPVKSYLDEREVKSIGSGTTFPHDLTSMEEIKSAIYSLSDTVAEKLRAGNLKCSTVQLTIRDRDFATITRQKGISPTNALHKIATECLSLFESRWESGKPVRMLTVTASSLFASDSPTQLSLFDEEEGCEKHEKVDAAMDAIKQKFGAGMVFRAGNMPSDTKKTTDGSR
ncbi:MAG: DNA polymerase IV, partial [Clostridia bacterium]|nr:DNA polymerase IV [Clostridia bacterium]